MCGIVELDHNFIVGILREGILKKLLVRKKIPMLSEMVCILSDFLCEIITLFLETIMTALIIIIHYKVIQSCPLFHFVAI